MGFPGGSVVKKKKDTYAMQETWVRSLGQKDPLEEGTATYCSFLAWRIPWTEEPGGAAVHGVAESSMNGTTWHACTHALLSDLDETKICSSRECDSIFGCDYILIPVRLKFVFTHLATSLNTALGFIFGFVLHLAGIHGLSVVGPF